MTDRSFEERGEPHEGSSFDPGGNESLRDNSFPTNASQRSPRLEHFAGLLSEATADCRLWHLWELVESLERAPDGRDAIVDVLSESFQNDPSALVRAASVTALKALVADKAFDIATEALNDSSPDVIIAGRQVLSDDRDSIRKLSQRLKDIFEEELGHELPGTPRTAVRLESCLQLAARSPAVARYLRRTVEKIALHHRALPAKHIAAVLNLAASKRTIQFFVGIALDDAPDDQRNPKDPEMHIRDRAAQILCFLDHTRFDNRVIGQIAARMSKKHFNDLETVERVQKIFGMLDPAVGIRALYDLEDQVPDTLKPRVVTTIQMLIETNRKAAEHALQIFRYGTERQRLFTSQIFLDLDDETLPPAARVLAASNYENNPVVRENLDYVIAGAVPDSDRLSPKLIELGLDQDHPGTCIAILHGLRGREPVGLDALAPVLHGFLERVTNTALIAETARAVAHLDLPGAHQALVQKLHSKGLTGVGQEVIKTALETLLKNAEDEDDDDDDGSSGVG